MNDTVIPLPATVAAANLCKILQIADSAQATSRRPEARPINQLERPLPNGPEELLKDRYLCRGGGLLLVGPTGIGKSSFSMQCMLSWALGKPIFDIRPARPLKSLLIQAENDDGDLAEMRDGVIKGMALTDSEAMGAGENVIVYREDAKSGDDFFADTVEPLLQDVKPDLLWIDPVLAYLEGETVSQKDVGKFLRQSLNPLIRKYGCGAVVVHHTNKPPSGAEKAKWSGGDLAYLGSGSAEWSNWSRAVLGLRSTGRPSIFELVAPKRGKHLKWKNPDGITATYSQFISHAKGEGEIYWRETTLEELEELGNYDKETPKKTDRKISEEILTQVPEHTCIEKSLLVEQCSSRDVCGIGKAGKLITSMVNSKILFEWSIPRKSGRPGIWIGRKAQPEDYKPGDELVVNG